MEIQHKARIFATKIMKCKLILDDGTKFWYKEDKLHREDGPAVEYSDGSRWWYKKGKCHREDGPAAELSNGNKYWYYDGKEIKCNSTEEFIKLLRLKVFW